MSEFVVEKFLKRRIQSGQTQYYLLWEEGDKTWEPKENLTGCSELLNEFIISKGNRFIAGKKDDEQTVYLMQWNDGWKNEKISSNEAKEKWPYLLFDFLRSKLVFKTIPTPAIEKKKGVRFVSPENENPAGNPIEISYVTKIGDNEMYWVQYQNEQYKFLDIDEVRKDCVNLAIKYFEARLEESEKHFGVKMITRKQKRDMLAAGMTDNFEVSIIRNVGLDSCAMFRLSKNVTRRRSIAAGAPLKSSLKKPQTIHNINNRRKSMLPRINLEMGPISTPPNASPSIGADTNDVDVDDFDANVGSTESIENPNDDDDNAYVGVPELFEPSGASHSIDKPSDTNTDASSGEKTLDEPFANTFGLFGVNSNSDSDSNDEPSVPRLYNWNPFKSTTNIPFAIGGRRRQSQGQPFPKKND